QSGYAQSKKLPASLLRRRLSFHGISADSGPPRAPLVSNGIPYRPHSNQDSPPSRLDGTLSLPARCPLLETAQEAHHGQDYGHLAQKSFRCPSALSYSHSQEWTFRD